MGAADAILRHRDTAERLGPEVVLRMGEPPASRVLNTWITDSGATELLVHEQGAWIDPDRRLDRIVVGQPSEWWDPLIAGVTPAEPSWLDGWQEAEAAAQQAIDDVLAEHTEPTEPGVARTLLAELPDHARLVVASSMPIRDLEWYGAPRAGVWVEANRGANGIDGVVSTAVGVALASNAPTVALVGDLAFLHDTSALVGLVRRPADLTIVVVDNDGGGIFSFLPQRSQLPSERFEQLLGTPHGVDIGALGAVHGLRVTRPERSEDVGPAVNDALGSPGPQLVHVRTDRDANVAVHDELHAAVAAALERLPDATSLGRGGCHRAKRTSRPDEGGEHGLELGPGLGQLGGGVGVADDAVARVDVGGRAVDAGAADGDRPGAVAGGVDPAHRAAVAAAVEPLELGDDRERTLAGPAAHRRGGVQGLHELEHRRGRVRQPALDQGGQVLDVGQRDHRRLGLVVDVRAEPQQRVVDHVDGDLVLVAVGGRAEEGGRGGGIDLAGRPGGRWCRPSVGR